MALTFKSKQQRKLPIFKLLALALFVTLLACYPVHVMADEKGRFAISSASPYGVFIIDTKTSKIRFCQVKKWDKERQVYQQTPRCGGWSLGKGSLE